MANIKGTSGDDTLLGTNSKDAILGFGGADILYGYGGADDIRGGDGNDTILGGDGDDTWLHGDNGNDIVQGGAGNDRVMGGNGDDQLFGDEGNDVLLGGLGNDVLRGGDGNDIIDGGVGGDQLYGGAGADVFRYFYSAWDSTTRTDWYGDTVATGVDTIFDFQTGIDIIDLSSIDANELTPRQQIRQRGGVVETGNEAFVVVQSTDGVTPGHLVAVFDGTNTTIYGYIDNVAGADFMLQVNGEVNPLTDLVL